MAETIELCLAGQMVYLPTGTAASLPYLPWSPEAVASMTEEDREEALKFIRQLRDRVSGK